MILTGYGLLALLLLVVTAYASWSAGREFGEHTGYNQGWNDANEHTLHKTYYEGTEQEKP